MARRQKIGKIQSVDDIPYDWKNIFNGRYKIACQGTCLPYIDRVDKKWKIVVYDTKNPEHLIYEFESETYNKIFYDE